jgi:excinuclease ABC subunit B
MFKIHSKYKPSGDQPKAIEKLADGLHNGKKDQVLLGITGSGKTFTMACIIEKLQKPAMIMVHNKTLAAQLYSEMKEFFPENAVEYFISYYDYYQPEAYIANRDVYIAKESVINEKINLLRHSATKSMLERRDVIVVASVSAIYGLGSPDVYSAMKLELTIGMQISIETIAHKLVQLQYKRNDIDCLRGSFSIKGDILDIFPPSSENSGIRLDFFGEEIETIKEFDIITRLTVQKFDKISIYPNGHYVAPFDQVRNCSTSILEEMRERVEYFKKRNLLLQAQRIEQRTKYDVEMMLETGSCKGIENYSRYLSGRGAGRPPATLFEYLAKDSILFVDESHVSTPQIGGMYAGDKSRKEVLIEHGFRLPSALDNRPLTFEEWDIIRPKTIFVSATPGKIELHKTSGEVVQQIIRPTGLLDPICEIRPAISQTQDAIKEIIECTKKGLRTLCITVTKKYAERLNEYLIELSIKSLYIHSEIDALERISILQSLREGKVDVLIGINLLREGIDIPECGLVLILDADKEGFLRSTNSLIQIIGRAARNSQGRVILYADKITQSIKDACELTSQRRKVQEEYNKINNITPQTVIKNLSTPFDFINKNEETKPSINKKQKQIAFTDPKKEIARLTKLMQQAAAKMDFEEASVYRDQIKQLQTDS